MIETRNMPHEIRKILVEYELKLEDLKEKFAKMSIRAEIAESKCRFLLHAASKVTPVPPSNPSPADSL